MHSTSWQKSSYSGDGSNCVEISTTPTAIHIRDSKHTEGPHVTVPPSAWTPFIQHASAVPPSPR
ncbi:DUF397 domain-containing protein [Streptomyces sp. B93]|uniref:DUF397 domain-containing protein n=1 Tax=Streptomyces sp. B93 TaxID=2824875 RepID=UPI001B364259|nr:DUF397 domain-containing protein [Streptomyces sp. B93]MBQ1092644.1 DUF397 domain-containing protein [Streptomyces sp. B93]